MRPLRTDWLTRSLAQVRRELLGRRREAYRAVFGPPGEPDVAQRRVLADLAGFCRAQRSCFDSDPRAHALLEGRREVWLRIQQTLRLTEEQVAELVEMSDDDD